MKKYITHGQHDDHDKKSQLLCRPHTDIFLTFLPTLSVKQLIIANRPTIMDLNHDCDQKYCRSQNSQITLVGYITGAATSFLISVPENQQVESLLNQLNRKDIS